MPRREESLASMRDALQLQDPEWDIVPGTAEYKILEAVAQQIENITYNSVLNDYHFDVDKKVGLELDLFMSLFGFARIKARRATGSVTFSRGSSATQDYITPLGSQVFVPATEFSPSLFFQTTFSAVLPVGSTEVSVPAQAVVAGTTGNVASATISGIATSIGGVTAVTNPQAFSGGRDAESDADLRDRWRRTVFRNISGTEDNFLAIAFNESAYVTRANLVGPIERHSEQIQLSAPYDLTTASPWTGTLDDAGGGLTNSETDVTVTTGHGDRFSVADSGDSDTWFYIGIFAGGAFTEIMKVTARAAGSNTMTVVRAANATTHTNGAAVRQVFPSSVPDSKYTFAPGGEVIGINTGLTSQQVGRHGETEDYVLITFDGTFGTGSTTPIPVGSTLPFLYVTTTGALIFGLDTVIEMEHEYTPVSSRNNFSGAGNKTADKVDIFVDGVDPVTVAEQFPIPTHSTVLFGTAFVETEYRRDNGVEYPVVGNFYTQLSKSPISTLPSNISIPASGSQDAITYNKDEDYWLVSHFDDPAGLEGSPRSSNGIEWRKPGTSPNNTFAATEQAGGKLDGFYAYVYTYELDGVETLPSDPPDGADNSGANNKNALTVPKIEDAPDSLTPGDYDVIWRKIYRSEGAESAILAAQGPFYLCKVLKNNTTVAVLDNRPDTALNFNFQPPKEAPEAGKLVSIEYNYNRLIERLDAQIDQVRLVGMDVLAHAADEVQLRFNLAVVLFSGMSVTDAEADINTILTAWINRKSFRNNIQIADVVEEVGQASGVDNVRLARVVEERDEVQKVLVDATRPTPDPLLDRFTITIGGQTTGTMPYNEDIGTVRETLESLSNLQEGNTFATTLNANIASTSVTSASLNDNPGLHPGGDDEFFDPILQEYWIQINDEIMEVTSVTDSGATLSLTVKRGQLGTTATTHTANDSVHILGDVGVSKVTVGTLNTFTISFLPNKYTGLNNWGTRKLDLITAAPSDDLARVDVSTVRKVQGAGSGVQVIAANDLTIVSTYYDDFYLDSDELPSIAGVSLVVKAQNTF